MATQITPLPTPPLRSDPANFATRGDSFLAALPTFQVEANALSAEVWALYATILAQTSDPLAKGTSTTSTTPATGAKTFTTQTGKGFAAGNSVIVSSAANRAIWMWGVVSAYNTSTGQLDVTVAQIGTASAAADWDILLSNPPLAPKVTDFTAGGTWTKDATKATTIVQVLGAGGGGGGSIASAVTGQPGGGGGGAYCEATFKSADLAASVTVTVGAGGAGGNTSGTSGGVGGTSSFGTLLTAAGGGGGCGNGGGAAGGNGGGGGGGVFGAGVTGSAAAVFAGGNGGTGGIGLKTYGVGLTGPTGSPQNTSGTVGLDAEAKPLAGGTGGSGGGSSTTTASLAGARGGCALWGGAGGGSGGGVANSTPATPSAGGPGGISSFGGHGGGGAGGGQNGYAGTAGAGGSGGLNPLVGSGGAAGVNADGTAGGVGCGGGAGGNYATTARAGGAGGRGQVRIIEF